MSDLTDKRFQAGVFEAVSVLNRNAGSGGGSGMQVMVPVAQPNNSNNLLTITSTTYVDVSGVTVDIQIARPMFIRVDCQSIGKTAGAVGSQAFGALHIDGVLAGGAAISAASFMWDKANGGNTCNYGWQVIFLQPGKHTIAFKVKVDNGQTWTNWYTEIDIYQLGG